MGQVHESGQDGCSVLTLAPEDAIYISARWPVEEGVRDEQTWIDRGAPWRACEHDGAQPHGVHAQADGEGLVVVWRNFESMKRWHWAVGLCSRSKTSRLS